MTKFETKYNSIPTIEYYAGEPNRLTFDEIENPLEVIWRKIPILTSGQPCAAEIYGIVRSLEQPLDEYSTTGVLFESYIPKATVVLPFSTDAFVVLRNGKDLPVPNNSNRTIRYGYFLNPSLFEW